MIDQNTNGSSRELLCHDTRQATVRRTLQAQPTYNMTAQTEVCDKIDTLVLIRPHSHMA